MTVSWDNVILDPIYSYGFTGGPGFGTRVVQTDGGGEERVQILAEPIWSWSAERENVGALADVNGLRDFFLARRGALYGFLFVDPVDFSTGSDGTGAPSQLDEVVGYGDGTTTTFTMRKTYVDPGGQTSRDYARRIIPITGTATAAMAALFPGVSTGDSINPVVWVNGVLQVFGTDYAISAAGKIIFATAPAETYQIIAGCYFTTPVRFSEDTDIAFDMTADSFQGDSASYGIVSLPYDEEVPVIPGSTEYGFVDWSASTKSLDSLESHWYRYTGSTVTTAYLPSTGYYPLGGPHFRIINDGTSSGVITLKDSSGDTISTIDTTEAAVVYIRENEAGARVPAVVKYNKV